MIFTLRTKQFTQSIFLDTSLDIALKMTSLKSSYREIWKYLNHGGFSLQMGAQNTFVRIALDHAVEEKANKNTQTPSRTKGYNLKSDTVVCYCTPLLQTTDDLFFWMLGEMVSYILQHR